MYKTPCCDYETQGRSEEIDRCGRWSASMGLAFSPIMDQTRWKLVPMELTVGTTDAFWGVGDVRC